MHLAEVQGRLNRELLAIEVIGDERHGLLITIDQMTSRTLPVSPPLVRVRHDDDGEPIQTTAEIELGEISDSRAADDDNDNEMRRHRVLVDVPERLRNRAPGSKLITVSIEGRDAPTRTTSGRYSRVPTDGHRRSSESRRRA